jgi:hypothetical protein
MSFGRTSFLSLVVITVSFSAFSQSKKPVSKKGLAVNKSICISGTFSFKCPKDYEVLLSGTTDDRLFFANNAENRYGVFVIIEPKESSIVESLPKITKVFLPSESQKFEWKQVEADPRKSSKFEIESKRQIGMNGGKAYLTLEYRLIQYNGKKLLTGTVVNGYEGPVGIKESFEKGDYTVNSGCFDSVDIIAAFTKEKLDPEKGPCVFTITMSPRI